MHAINRQKPISIASNESTAWKLLYGHDQIGEENPLEIRKLFMVHSTNFPYKFVRSQ